MTIPASQLVNFIPSVLAAGGNALNIIGVMLTQNTRVPIGALQSFASAAAVASALGASSIDASAASIYFQGPTNASQVPGQMLVAQYNLTAVPAYLRSASLASLTLAQLQTVSGTLTVTMDGYSRTSAVVLSGASSFSAAAATIQADLNAALPTVATATASIAGTTLTVTGTLTGQIAVGQTVTGSNTSAGSILLAQLTGVAGGTGTYQLAVATGTVTSQTLTFTATALTVTFDSVTNAFVFTSGITGTISTAAFATGALSGTLSLTGSTGGVLSQGAAPASPAAFMNVLTLVSTNWATFFYNFDPDQGAGNAIKLATAAWVSTTNNRYAYLAGDTDVNPTLSVPAASSLAQLVTAAGYGGVCPIYDPTFYKIPAFIAGTAASINFNTPNGRITFAYKGQAGLPVSVTSGTVAQNLLANGYNFYGAYATANQQFNLFQNGSVSGPFAWLDSYINQIWLNAQMQLVVLQFMANVTSNPYNRAGYTAIENALATIIAQGLSFGAFSSGVVLSSAQIQQVNQIAGANVAGILQTQGYYLRVSDPGPAVRAVRGSPTCVFFYADGGSIQLITFSAIQVQ
jgi:Protein of unknown function (DUF3383)